MIKKALKILFVCLITLSSCKLSSMKRVSDDDQQKFKYKKFKIESSSIQSLPKEIKIYIIGFCFDLSSPEALLQSIKTLIQLRIVSVNFNEILSNKELNIELTKQLQRENKEINDIIENQRWNTLHKMVLLQYSNQKFEQFFDIIYKNRENIIKPDAKIGITALHLLVRNRNIQLLEYVFINLGNQISDAAMYQDSVDQQTILHLACVESIDTDKEIVKCILKYTNNSLLFKKNYAGCVALHDLAMNNNTEVAQLLLDAAGENAELLILKKSDDDDNSLDLAKLYNAENVIALFKSLLKK